MFIINETVISLKWSRACKALTVAHGAIAIIY